MAAVASGACSGTVTSGTGAAAGSATAGMLRTCPRSSQISTFGANQAPTSTPQLRLGVLFYLQKPNLIFYLYFYILTPMRLHRFYITQKISKNENITLADQELIHQISHVFRLKAYDQVILFDGSGFEYVSQIISPAKKEIVFKILEKKNPLTQTGKISKNKNKKVSLYLSLIKKNNFELATEKVTEIGVAEIHPIISERSEKKDINLERLNKIVKEASEQSGRVILPEVFDVISLKEVVSQAVKENKVCIAFHTVDNLPEVPPPTSESIAIFIGPEGGWTENEIAIFKEHNVQLCSLGSNILRAETAAIVASALFLTF